MNAPVTACAGRRERLPLLAREGWGPSALVVALAVALSLWQGWLAALPAWALAVLVLQFFRDPPRVIAPVAGGVLCPADGRVIALARGADPYLGREALKISIFMNVFNVHSNRLPVEGRVRKRWYHPGRFVNAALAKASAENERNALWITTPAGDDVVVVQVAGLIARRILCYVKEGDLVSAGGRYGFIRFGSRVDVYLPIGAHPEVALGDRVQAGSQLLARLRDQSDL